MSIDTDTIEIPKPKKTPKITNHDLLYGKPVTPIERLNHMSDEMYEEFILAWANEYLPSKYKKLRRCGGAGDKGRDVIGILDSTTKEWDNYQCKHYGNELTPTNFYVELGKLCYYTFQNEYTIPNNYYIIGKNGVGTKLGDLLEDPTKLRTKLIENWTKYVESKITKKGDGKVKLENGLKGYVEKFDFSIVKAIEPHELIEQFKETSSFLYYFGGSITKYREETIVPPIDDNETKMRYVEQLLIAYSEEVSKEINSIKELMDYGLFEVHFNLQRKNFYSVETLKQFERDNLPPDSSAFDDLKDEILTAIYSKVVATYENSFKRLESVLSHSTLLNITSNPLSVTISLHDKQGICHHLVNDNKISWKI